MPGRPHLLTCQRVFRPDLVSSRHVLIYGLIVVLLRVVTGCAVAPLQVEREDDLIQRLGIRAVQEEMSDVLARTYDPPTKAVTFKPDRLTILFSLKSVDKTYLEDAQTRRDLIYTQVQKLEPYANGRVFVDRLDGASIQLNFRYPDDAEVFTKLFYALKAHAEFRPVKTPS